MAAVCRTTAAAIAVTASKSACWRRFDKGRTAAVCHHGHPTTCHTGRSLLAARTQGDQ